jgi:hypothetical protein
MNNQKARRLMLKIWKAVISQKTSSVSSLMMLSKGQKIRRREKRRRDKRGARPVPTVGKLLSSNGKLSMDRDGKRDKVALD